MISIGGIVITLWEYRASAKGALVKSLSMEPEVREYV